MQLTRSSDARVDLKTRNAAIGERNATVYLSIHFNTSFSPEDAGYRIILHNPTDAMALSPTTNNRNAMLQRVASSRKLADSLQLAFHQAGFQGERIEMPMVTLREISVPAVHLEVAYLSNSGEASLWKNLTTMERAAEAIWGGLARYRP